MTPSVLAKTAQTLAKGTKVSVKVLGQKELKKLKMNLLLAVGQGTKEETKLIVLEYKGAAALKEKPIVFVGKGITYDTGGLNVKPSGHMHDMHMDMSGGSSVIAAILCAAKLGIKKNIVALVPAAENAISDDAMRPGDIITSMSGKTVEVLHTDAEGRMVLADALTYSKRYDPKVALDVATLTGAALVALGQHASAIMTKDDVLEATLRRLGEESGDYVWPLPLWDEYQQYIKSTRADISNIATNFSRFGGTIEGAAFLANFAPECPWAHIDIAPRMESIASDKLAKGSTGEPVRLLVKFAENY
jgi:leucyl aminopeptidase